MYDVKRLCRARLDIRVQAFDGLSAGTRAQVGAEAERVAAVRGASDVRVRYDQA